MTFVTTTNTSFDLIVPDPYLVDDDGYAAFRVLLYGNIHESSLHTMNYAKAIPLMQLRPDELSKHLMRRKKAELVRGLGGNVFELPELPDFVPHAQFCGVVIDRDFRGVVEDGNGEVVYDFTKRVYEAAGAAHCNDNDRFEVREGDFIDLYDDDDEDVVEVGLLKLERVAPGVIEHRFCVRDGFDPRLLDIKLFGIERRKLTDGVLYDGSYADEVDGFRWSEVLPTAKIRIAKL